MIAVFRWSCSGFRVRVGAAEAWFVAQESAVITHFLLMCLLCVVHHIGVSAALNDAAKGQRLVPH